MSSDRNSISINKTIIKPGGLGRGLEVFPNEKSGYKENE
jgi:hypothetical protein